jgi:hypothetical protein
MIMDDNYSRVFALYTQPWGSQARPVDLSGRLPGRRLHLKSIAFGLQRIRANLIYSIHALQYFFSGDKPAFDHDTTSYMLSSSTILLQGLLDGLIICALEAGTLPDQAMSFQRTPFAEQRLLDIQNTIKSLQSSHKTNTTCYADFWTISNFWKHYLPCAPQPVQIDNIFDYEIELGSGKSGPLIHDLIIPTFNGACKIVEIIGVQLGMDRDDWFVPCIDLTSRT